MSDEAAFQPSATRRFNRTKIATIGMVGYLLGSFFPAGYVRYFIQSKIFPETLVHVEDKFDRTKLRGAIPVSPKELTETLDINPSLFRQKYLDKPVTLAGKVEFFLDSSTNPSDLTLTLDMGEEYGATSVIMTFDNSKDERVLALRKNTTVRATCMTSGITSDSVHLNHCEALK